MTDNRRRYARRGDAERGDKGGGFPWGRTLIALVVVLVAASVVVAAVGGDAGDPDQGPAAYDPARDGTVREWRDLLHETVAYGREWCGPAHDVEDCIGVLVSTANLREANMRDVEPHAKGPPCLSGVEAGVYREFKSLAQDVGGAERGWDGELDGLHARLDALDASIDAAPCDAGGY
jgi:hypothetical protein